MSTALHARPAAAAATRRQGDLAADIRMLAKAELAPLVGAIDRDGVYPEAFMRRLGEAGAFRPHLSGGTAATEPDLLTAIDAVAAVAETCTATAFMAWCQTTLAWYIANSDNEAQKARFLQPVASGRLLGGTGLSNPMKSFFGIERMKLRGTRAPGGWRVTGALPWVSNLAPGHVFGTIFEVEGEPTRRVMIIADCAADGVSLRACDPFLAMDGTGTYAIQFRDTFVPDRQVLADRIDAYLPRIRAGFILLQTGMAIGTIRDCIAIMNEVRPTLGHINRHLEDQPEDIEAALDDIRRELTVLSATPYDPSPTYFRRVVALRLAAGEATVKAAHCAMLHAGARGYVATHRAQRRLREAYFVAIVTPATKQLRKMLADMDAAA
jgi:alkylation response protein AidB-like acyl-CoA dehydrogenase